jgi:hypothetical protein
MIAVNPTDEELVCDFGTGKAALTVTDDERNLERREVPDAACTVLTRARSTPWLSNRNLLKNKKRTASISGFSGYDAARSLWVIFDDLVRDGRGSRSYAIQPLSRNLSISSLLLMVQYAQAMLFLCA